LLLNKFVTNCVVPLMCGGRVPWNIRNIPIYTPAATNTQTRPSLSSSLILLDMILMQYPEAFGDIRHLRIGSRNCSFMENALWRKSISTTL